LRTVEQSAVAPQQRQLGACQPVYIDAVKSTRRIKVAVSPDVAAKVAAAAARVALTKEQALEIASAEPRNATIFAGPLRKASARQRAGR
jgi:hypothetical protein